MRKSIIPYIIIIAGMCLAVSCGNRYQDPPFGGMNGRVQKVTITHKDPEVYHTTYDRIIFIGTSVYDMNGNEICSAVMDSTGRILSESESLFENGVSIRSTRKAGNRVVARLDLISNKGNKLEYRKESNGQISTMTVKKSSLFRKHKSVMSENGTVITIRTIKTDRDGYPVMITTEDPRTGTKTVETNILDDRHNVKEKHTVTDGNEDDKEVTYIVYKDFDEQGNWREARTFNRFKLPVEVLLRDIEYWK